MTTRPSEDRGIASIHATRFVVRTPLLPVDAFTRWGEGLRSHVAPADGDELAAAVVEDRATLRDRITGMLADPKIQESIYLAAPGLIEGLDRWRQDPESKAGQDVERSLVRYLTRMSCRATPFGLLSGLSLGRIGDEVRGELGPITEARRRVELDADTLYAVSSACADAPEVWSRGRLFPNTSLTLCDDAFRYTESVIGDAGLSYLLVSVPASEALLRVVQRADGGARVADLVDAIRAVEPDVDEPDALEFLRELVDNDLLQSELRPCVTGDRPTVALLGSLRACDHPAAIVLTKVESRLRALDDVELGVPSATYETIAADLRTLHGHQGKRCFHAQLHKHGDDLRLDQATIDRVTRTVETILQITPMQDSLAAFKDAFVERYGDGERWVGLCEVLDEERGIGFGASAKDASPLLSGIPLGGTAGARPGSTFVDLMRTALWQRAVEGGKHEIELDRGELWALAGGPKVPPPPRRQALAVSFSLARRANGGAVEIIYRWAGGPSGARVLGRFAHGHPDIDAIAREHIAAEEADDPDVVFAEIAHIPEGRMANVIARPVLRRFEIPCLGRSGAAPADQLPLADLEVCVAGNRVHLRSRKLGKRVLPRLSSAHNTQLSGVSAYRFLDALQMQEISVGAKWSWGSLAEVARFLPRLRIDGVVVSCAQWRLAHAELAELRAARKPVARFAAISRLRAARILPRYVQFGSSDQRVVIDLDNTLSIDALVNMLPNFGAIELVEWYPAPTDQFVRGPEGTYEAEYCVPIVRIPREPAGPVVTPPSPSDSARIFSPGSSWSYLELYGGFAATEHALVSSFAPLLETLQAEGAIDRWFFIRYGVPRWHLRLRVHGDPVVLRRRVEPEILGRAERLRAGGSLWKIEIATYTRETQRYGGDAAIEAVEQIFAVDSRACARLLGVIAGDHETRWTTTLLGMDEIVRIMGFDDARRVDLMTSLARGRLAGLDPASVSAKPIARRHRELRSRIERWLARDVPPAIAGIMDERARQLAEPAAAMRRLADGGGLTRPFDAIVGDLLHMHANRMFRSDANAQECVLYEFLRRAYRSAVACRDAKPVTAAEAASGG
jgi:lantibiotic biosynthesis protein